MDTARNKEIVRGFFAAMSRGDPKLPELFCDDIGWWVPPEANLGGLHQGKPAVLALMASGIGLYDLTTPMRVEIEQLVAEGDWVCAQLVIEARTARGEPYRNHYHFAFRLRDGRIALVKEYVDTLYADRKLFRAAAG